MSNYFTKSSNILNIIFIILFYLIFFYYFHVDTLGYWESVSAYSILKPSSYPFVGNIQIAADTTGGHGISYPFILISKYFAKIFTLSFSSIKYIFICYSVIFLILFYLTVKYFIDTLTAFFSSILIILNPYFLYMGSMLISQQFTLTFIFLNIFLFLKFEKNESKLVFYLVSLSISLLLMNYILGRYIVLITILYFFFRASFKTNFKKNIFVKNIKRYLKIILISFVLLIIIFPPNFGVLFSQNLFFPFTALKTGGETLLFDSKIYETFYLNIKHVINFYFLNFDGNYNFNIINSEPINLFSIFSLVFLIFGIFNSLKNQDLILFNLIFFIILFLVFLSNSNIEKGEVTSTSISVYRLYFLFPFIVIFICYGVKELIDLLIKNKKINENFKITIFIILTTISFWGIFSSNSNYRIIENHYQAKNYLEEVSPLEKIKGYKYINSLDYHMKIRSLSKQIVSLIESKNNNINLEKQYFYLIFDKDLKFLKYPPRLRDDNITKYTKHIFFTLYLNDIGKGKYTFLYKANDEITLSSKIREYKNKMHNETNTLDKKIAKKIANLLNNFIYVPEKIEKYKAYKINYFDDYEYLILFNEKEYLYAKNFLGLKVNVINISKLLK